jgi:5-methylcytosine-specific restriction endonuclease McrA
MHWFKRRHPLCHDCHYKATTDGHHILKVKDHPELRLVESNVMGLCGACHAARTGLGQ